MGKRSAFASNKNDAYDTTDPKAVRALLPHLAPGRRFVEPCAGKGDLVRQLEAAGHRCVAAIDIAPRGPGIAVGDAATLRLADLDEAADEIWTNPPWTPELLHPIIANLFWQAPVWMLLSADWMHTAQAAPYMAVCSRVVSVGRVKWVPGTPHSSLDNCCWYRFEARRPVIYGRAG